MVKMSAKRHLRELQWRFMVIAVFFVIGACLAYSYRDILLPFLLQPLHGEKLVYLTPGGGFSFVFLVSIYAGLAMAFPAFLHQIYNFLRPALPTAAQRKSATIIISSVILLIAGIAFGYYVAVPNALTFLYGFADQYVESSLTAESYLNFVVSYTLGIGIVFQIPLLLLLINAIKPFTPGGIMKSEKWVVLGAFIVAAIITPTPDPVNQAIVAGPVIVVYQFGVIAVLVSIAKAHRRKKATHKLSAEELKRNAVIDLTPARLAHRGLKQSAIVARRKSKEALIIAAREARMRAQQSAKQQAQQRPQPTLKVIDGIIPRRAPA